MRQYKILNVNNITSFLLIYNFLRFSNYMQLFYITTIIFRQKFWLKILWQNTFRRGTFKKVRCKCRRSRIILYFRILDFPKIIFENKTYYLVFRNFVIVRIDSGRIDSEDKWVKRFAVVCLVTKNRISRMSISGVVLFTINEPSTSKRFT